MLQFPPLQNENKRLLISIAVKFECTLRTQHSAWAWWWLVIMKRYLLVSLHSPFCLVVVMGTYDWVLAFFCLTLGSLCHITIFSIYNCCFVRFPTVPSSGCTAVGCLSLLFFYFADQNVQCPLRNLSIPRGHKDCFSQSQDGLTWGLQGTQWAIFSRAPQGLEFVPPPLVSCPQVTTPFLGFLRTTQYLTGKRVKAADGLTIEGWLPQVPFETALVFRR